MSEVPRVEGYAEALFAVAHVEDALDVVADELHDVRDAIAGDDQLRMALTDPMIPSERRQAVVERLIGDRAHPVTTNLVSFLVGAGRAGDLPAIVDRMVQMTAESHDAVVAEVRSAHPLSDDQRRRLADALAERTGQAVDVRVSVDPAILGGVITQIGDTVIDGSVRTRLARLRDRF